MLTPVSQEHLKGIQKWGKISGILTIIMGSLNALFGALFFLVGAIPGIIQIFLGLHMTKVAKHSENLAPEYNDGDMNGLLENFRKYLKLYGIYYICSLILGLIALIIYGVVIASMVSSGFEGYY